MKKIKHSLLALVVTTGCLMSCQKDKWLNPQLTTAIPDATAFDTRDRVAKKINGLYPAVKPGRYLGSR